MAKEKIFISYSRDDLEFVTRLVKGLRDKGKHVWFDSQIRSGSQWDRTIEKEIRACDILITVMSETSVDSPNVMDEVSLAIDLNKRIIPILMRECDIPMRLRRYQYVDFTQGVQWGFNRLLDDIENPDKFDQNRHHRIKKKPKKKSNNLVLFLLGGLVSIVAFILLVGIFFNEEEDPIDPGGIKSNIIQTEEPINNYKTNVEPVHNDPGPSTPDPYEEPESETRTGYVLYSNPFGQVFFNKAEGGYPYVGDILYVMADRYVYNQNLVQTGDIIYQGEQVEVLQVMPGTADGYYYLRVRYIY